MKDVLTEGFSSCCGHRYDGLVPEYKLSLDACCRARGITNSLMIRLDRCGNTCQVVAFSLSHY